MIPKIIHFCWLSNEPYPKLIEKCISSWEKTLSDYQIKKWDTTNFDVNSVPFVKEAFEHRKWAFAADYIRLYALYTEGGVYLDSDVFVRKSFNDFLENSFFTSIEYNDKDYVESLSSKLINKNGDLNIDSIIIPGLGLQAAVIGSVKEHPYIKDCLDYYTGKHFVLANGSYNNQIIAPDILAHNAIKYGFKYKNSKQVLDNGMLILPSNFVAGHPKIQHHNNLAIHCCTGTWRNLSLLDRIVKFIRYKFYLK